MFHSGGMGGMGGMGGLGGLFGHMSGGGSRGGGGPRSAQHTAHPLKVTLEELYKGKTTKLKISRNIVCSSCEGAGGKKGSEVECNGCDGHGIVLIQKQIGPGMVQQMQQLCPECRGQGRSMAEKDKCKTCKGVRTTKDTKMLQVAIPPGSAHEQNIRLRGEGDQTPGAPPADVIIVLDELKHAVFERKGADLHMKKEIQLREALCGTTIVVGHVSGKDIVINITSGDILRPECMRCVRGLGMPTRRDASKFGDLFVTFDVTLPDTFNESVVKVLSKLLPSKDDTITSPPPDGVHIDEVCLQPFEERHFRGSKRGGGAACESSDEEMGEPRNVQCAHQ